MVTGLHVAACVLALSSGCSLAAAVDDVSLVQAALKVGVFEPEKLAPSSLRLGEEPPTWPPRDPWLVDLVVEKLGKGKFRESFLGDHIIVYPPAKLAFCWIPKIACTEFNLLMNRLNGIPGDYAASNPGRFKLSLAAASREKGWKWAIFLRDPLIRFLSAWGDKCRADARGRGYCWPYGSFTKHTPGTAASVADFHRHVLKAWSAYLQDGLPANTHWRPQKEFYGNGTENYDFVGHLSGDVHAQVRGMLEMVGAPTGDLEQFFPKVGRAGAGVTTMLDPNLYYSNATLRWMVGEMYKQDYTLPGLGEPPKKP